MFFGCFGISVIKQKNLKLTKLVRLLEKQEIPVSSVPSSTCHKNQPQWTLLTIHQSSCLRQEHMVDALKTSKQKHRQWVRSQRYLRAWGASNFRKQYWNWCRLKRLEDPREGGNPDSHTVIKTGPTGRQGTSAVFSVSTADTRSTKDTLNAGSVPISSNGFLFLAFGFFQLLKVFLKKLHSDCVFHPNPENFQ